MKEFSYVDETLDLNRAHAYRLSIQVSLDGFSFSILDQVREKFVLLKHHDLSDLPLPEEKGEKLDKIMSEDPYLKPSYQKTMAMVATGKSTLIPAAYFQEKDLKQYLEFNHDMDELEEIHYNYLDGLGAYTIFTLPNPLSNAMIRHLGRIHYYHQGLPFITWHIDNAPASRKRAALSIYENFADIGVFSKNKLHFYNTFRWSAGEDLLYYVLYVFKQLNLDVSSNEIYISGNAKSRKELRNLLERYIKRIHFQAPPERFTYSYTFKKESAQHFTNLFRLSLCV